jgi:hypothetical protein
MHVPWSVGSRLRGNDEHGDRRAGACKRQEKRGAGDISRAPPQSSAMRTCYFWVMATEPTPTFKSTFNVTAVVPQAALR